MKAEEFTTPEDLQHWRRAFLERYVGKERADAVLALPEWMLDEAAEIAFPGVANSSYLWEDADPNGEPSRPKAETFCRIAELLGRRSA